jgi:hypothetical protein
LATPHLGAQAATALDALLGRYKSKQTKQLAYADDGLIDLNEFFRSWVARSSVSVKSYYETEKTWGIRIVDKVSANPAILGSEPVPVQSDHISICKPPKRTSPVFASVCTMIKGLLKKLTIPDAGGKSGGGGEQSDCVAVSTDVQADYEYYTTKADEDRRDLEQKLKDADRSYSIAEAKRKKERFNMALQRSIAQPAAVTRYTRLMSDVETRFHRHVGGVIANGGSDAEVNHAVQTHVVDPCLETHSQKESEITSAMVDGALYYLAGNCHLAWDNG